MNLLLRGFDSKEVAENVAAEIIKRGVAKSAHVDVPNGDLSAAQEYLAATWPVFSLLAGGAKVYPEVRRMISKMQDDLRPLYTRAMGDT